MIDRNRQLHQVTRRFNHRDGALPGPPLHAAGAVRLDRVEPVLIRRAETLGSQRRTKCRLRGPERPGDKYHHNGCDQAPLTGARATIWRTTDDRDEEEGERPERD